MDRYKKIKGYTSEPEIDLQRVRIDRNKTIRGYICVYRPINRFTKSKKNKTKLKDTR